ncbi:MAG: glucoamylase family protein [bacterium]
MEQLCQHARVLAGRHQPDPTRVRDRLLQRLAQNEAVLAQAYNVLADAVDEGREIPAIAEWLMDNFYLIEEQIRSARHHLPKSYSRELPRLRNGQQPGVPRVYEIAQQLISHSDARLDAENITRFVAAYQEAVFLKLGELWAVPIMLRLALIENLRRVAGKIIVRHVAYEAAARWADRLIDRAEKTPRKLVLVVAEMALSDVPLSSAFVTEFTRRMQGQPGELALPLSWLEQQLTHAGVTVEQLVQSESHQQATEQVSISNSILSLRCLESIDWHDFVETLSIVEQTLRQDPAGLYGATDFPTRDDCRRAVEQISRQGGLPEQRVAELALELARPAHTGGGLGERAAYVGYNLIGPGLNRLKKASHVRPGIRERAAQIGGRRPLAFYLGAVFTFAALATGLVLACLAGNIAPPLTAVFAVLVFFCSAQLSVELVNRAAMLLIGPRRLPRMDFSTGIPPEFETMVTVPTMLSSCHAIQQLLEGLEIRYLANRQDNLYFSLLTDFPDAPLEEMPEDAQLIDEAVRGIEALNIKHCQEAAAGPFYLFHRPRMWNAQNGVWMGRERKRGKLSDLNALLRGDASDRFSVIAGDLDALRPVTYVITLDTDTLLPRDSARQLAATMAHPLNRPVYDGILGLVREGYGILQPRISTDLPVSTQSRFFKLSAGQRGIDPYTRTVSDVYQDLFGQGSFIGKGIYDVDAFQRTLEGRFPENLILSHDLIEGCYARSGLVSDVQLYENFPTRYSTDANRRRRWIRGDWQIAQWALPWSPGPTGKPVKNPLSALSRWKIFDNLRRSLIPSSLLLLLLLGWFVAPLPALWTVVVIALVLGPGLLSSLTDFCRKPQDLPLWLHLPGEARLLRQRLGQSLFSLIMLPYEAHFSLDSICRSLTRMLITRKGLLDWVTSADAERAASTGLAGTIRQMCLGPAAAMVTAAGLLVWRPFAVPFAAPFLAGWFLSPLIAWWVSCPLAARTSRLTGEQLRFLGIRARKTWRFFETFAGRDDNWLPADNHQDYPAANTAHRTSPTNIGISLLSGLAAHDFGYISTGNFVKRTANTLATLKRMEKFRGHLYNWYDTRSLQPLLPLFVSTVDSGNFAGHLLILRQGLLALADASLVPGTMCAGLKHTLHALAESVLDKNGETSSPSVEALEQFGAAVERMERLLDNSPVSICGTMARLKDAAAAAAELTAGVAGLRNADLSWWCEGLEQQCRDFIDELSGAAPWACVIGEIDGDLPDDNPVYGDLRRLTRDLNQGATLRQMTAYEEPLLPLIDIAIEELAKGNGNNDPAVIKRLHRLRQTVTQAADRARNRIRGIERLAALCGELSEFECDFLYDISRNLFTVGYHTAERRRDSSLYDLLASEARLASFVAIAHGQVPQKHWFSLGRQLTMAGGETALLSWSGSMFEYLMPNLVMPSFADTLLDHTCRAIVDRQIEYGRQRGVPWGISESGYNVINARLDYQYRTFGVPGLGLKRGLSKDVVIAPYATMLALMIDAEEACANLQTMVALGDEGPYGMYEAIDYTPSRLPRGQSSALVRSFMAHHQGMSFLSLACLLLDRPMQRRFALDPQLRATELLLQERIPKAAPFYPHTVEVAATHASTQREEDLVSVFNSPHSAHPKVQLLSNGRYSVAISTAGGGLSRWHELSVTRWREDATLDNWGQFCYIRDADSGEFWSATHQPVRRESRHYEAIFSHGRAEFRRTDAGIDTHSEIVVSSEDDVEMRRTTLTNRSRARRRIEVTTYAEVVLANQSSDEAHPAFSNLFVMTEIVRSREAILCTRRPRAPGEHHPYLLHVLAMHANEAGEASYETDRLKFIGRGNSVTDPLAMHGNTLLSGSEGPVLDPILAIRRIVVLQPDEKAIVDVITGIAETRDAALALVEKYRDRRLAERTIELAWTHDQVMFRQIQATQRDLTVYQQLAAAILYTNPAHRANPKTLMQNRRGQPGLWGYGISGDLPIVLLRIDDQSHIALVRETVQAHTYWRGMGLAADLLIVNESRSGYHQVLQDDIVALVTASGEPADRPGGVFVRRADQMPEEDRVLLLASARVILTGGSGTLAEQARRRGRPEATIPPLAPARPIRPAAAKTEEPPYRELLFHNGIGGFTTDGREYVITTRPGNRTPAPWVNVMANPFFGTVVTESGGGYTWSENAHEFRLTPWSNDAVSDTSGEALYIRDEETGAFWSPTPLPAGGVAPYVTRHGFGYSVFEHWEHEIASELWVYVAIDAPVKFFALKLRNPTGRARRLSVTGYVEWILGELRRNSLLHVRTETDPKTAAMFACNPYHAGMADRVGFLDVSDSRRTVTGDRTEFLGRNGSRAAPAAMTRARLSDRIGAGMDPCGAMQAHLDMPPGDEQEIVFVLGAGRDKNHARSLAEQFKGAGAARKALEKVWEYWNRALGAVYVETPDKSFDVLANGWLVYQTLACRMWGRSGFYQSGGAFGFRDQLQDAMALVHTEPARLREHLLLCAANQFAEGDVQHWWHPPSGRGVRTRCSDDRLWLPLAVCRYIRAIGDTGVLDEQTAFLQAPPLRQDEESRYDLPARSHAPATLYEHCVRAINRSLDRGAHGLPLIMGGDWNDGMNLVGHEGKGESVWLAFFLHDVLRQFAGIARQRGDKDFAECCNTEAGLLHQSIERHAWDGEWYRRAYYDNGEPLGSAIQAECQIDSLSQSWAALTGAGSPLRCQTAMESFNRRLVRRDARLILLLDPPFDTSPQEPGYIKGYVPGVRENGGQYTHAAIWAAMAYAAAGDSEGAWDLMKLINPLNHSSAPDQIATYRVEPYVAAADVYGVPPHTGRGGWTWYTGSASWMYRLMIESLLGLNLEVDRLRLKPCLPQNWPEVRINYRYHDTCYQILIQRKDSGGGVLRVILDGMEQPGGTIPLKNDRQNHSAVVEVG